MMVTIEYLIKYLQTAPANLNHNGLTKIADLGCVAGLLFMVIYSYVTFWWAFIGLLLVNVLLFKLINSAVVMVNKIMSIKQVKVS